jgi:hypothetical protein
VNTERTGIDATITIEGLGDVELTSLLDAKRLKITGGNLKGRFAPCEAKVFTIGPAPRE